MGFYERYICPHISEVVNRGKAVQPMRRRIVSKAQGVVLEIGAGTGANFPYFDPQHVRKVYALEPSPGMLRLARRAANGMPFPVVFLDLPGERIPLADHTVDKVLITFTLCSIPDAVAALQGMARVLKPGGELLFCEHGAAPDAGVQQWQRWLEPVNRLIFPGCHLTRRIPDLIRQGGFRIREMSQGYAPGIPRPTGYIYEGVATTI
jgi:ubiquinone/menaquinone biosynthesis C-methylase UbiE